MSSLRDDAALRGRGASWNPVNRFGGTEYVTAEEQEGVCAGQEDEAFEAPRPGTQFLEDRSQSILSYNESPDVGFDVSVNPYRGCEHGCIYCYARPTHEYLGFSAGLEFETRILVKRRAPALLREALASPKWTPQPIAFSGVTDCYQPIERRLELTRACLEVMAAFRNPALIVTKNRLVARDADILGEMAGDRCAAVAVSIPTLDLTLNRALEPRSSSPTQRLEAIAALRAAGVPVRVLVAPVIPGITDHEIPSILQAAADAGAEGASYIMLRLPHAVAPLFERWLEQHYPARKEKVMSRIRDIRQGGLNESGFGARMRGHGVFAAQVRGLFRGALHRSGLAQAPFPLDANRFRRPGIDQLELW